MKIQLPIHHSNLSLPALLFLALSIICTQTPLLNYLGYEFSVVIALAATCVAGFRTITRVREAFLVQTEEPPGSSAVSTFRHSLVQNLLLLVIPLLIISLNAFFVKNCSWLEGFGFFFLIPVVTVIFSSALGLFCAVHYRWARTMFVMFFLATIVYVLALGYFTPAIFSFNFFYGWFPGLTYDETLGVSGSLVLFRCITAGLAGVLIWMSMLMLDNSKVSHPARAKGITLLKVLASVRYRTTTILLVLALVATWWFRGELGFESSASFIRKELGAKHATEHFTIFCAPESYDDEEVEWVAKEHEFRLQQIAAEFTLPFRGRIESYIYPSNEVKQRLMGAGSTNIAKPWNGQIHITKQSLDATLKHELVHVVAAQFGAPVLRASLSTGLVEGIAEAIDWNFGNRTLHQYAAAMHKAGVAPAIRPLMSFAGFAAHSSSVSYVLAGSFCRYLIDQYGMRKMMLLYRSNDYDRIYGKSLDALIAEWQQFLARIPVSQNDLGAIDVFFRRPPIFEKVCARVIANKNAEARKQFGLRMYDEAYTLFAEAYNESKAYESLSGMLVSALRSNRAGMVVSLYDSVLSTENRPRQFLPLYIHVADAFWDKGEPERALILLRQVESADFSEPYTEAAMLRRTAVTENSQKWRDYFLSDLTDSVRAVMLFSIVKIDTASQLPRFLLMKTLVRLKRFSEALSVAESFTFSSGSTSLEASRLRSLGFILFRLKRFEEAKGRFWQSLNFSSTESVKLNVNEWIDRCEWMRKSAP